MVTIVGKGQTDDLILVTVAIQKELLKVPLCREKIEVNNIVDDDIKQIIKDGL